METLVESSTLQWELHDEPLEERIMSIFSEQWALPPSLHEKEPPRKRRRSDSVQSPLIAPQHEPKRVKIEKIFQHSTGQLALPETQRVLLLHAMKEKYRLEEKYEMPKILHPEEIIVRTDAIGLNPIDWKAPDFGFGIPQLPCISGRDFAGTVVLDAKKASRINTGDVVIGISTDYRDLRKSAFQEYVVVNEFNSCRIPKNISQTKAASLGVAFVAAALSLGICCGVDFSSLMEKNKGPDLLQIVRSLSDGVLPKDIAAECLSGINSSERPKRGDWIAFWGGSSTTAIIAAQLAKLCGLKVISIVDVEKHGSKQFGRVVDLLVDSHNPERAINIVRSVTGGKLRFGIDTIGKITASSLSETLQTTSDDTITRSHLIGLSGVPKENKEGLAYHTVPIKLFHEVQSVGESLMVWLEKLLKDSEISLPDTLVLPGGLGAINDGLDMMRRGEISGKRLVIKS
ncbi:GroES-like protein [Microthyrium microscopicum]|uniref:GroES-like protein n=1 Tax=Microthyrium microscopicum TaxID=703497 RepID=A0A6A6U944_9PEZI|nr:GroES-like protein [Microthyrium microscopicum]